MSKKLRICFFGSPLFAVPSLDKLRKAEHEILCVITQPPKPANRGKKIYKQPVQEYAEKNGMKIFSPDNLYDLILYRLKSPVISKEIKEIRESVFSTYVSDIEGGATARYRDKLNEVIEGARCCGRRAQD